MGKKKGFNLPVIIPNVPVEISERIDKQISQDSAYVKLRERKIAETWNNVNSNLRAVGDFLYGRFQEEISYKEISKKLDIPEKTIRNLIGDLNFWSVYPFKFVPVRKKAGYIQSCLKNPEDTERAIIRRRRTIASMDRVTSNIENVVALKQPRKIRASKKLKKKRA